MDAFERFFYENEDYIKEISKRGGEIWNKTSEENRQKIKKLNRERAFKKRIDNINDFKEKLRSSEDDKCSSDKI